MTHTKTFAPLSISVEARVWDRQPFVLHENFATGETPDGKPFEITRSLPGGTMYIKLDNQIYEVRVKSIMDGLLEKLKEAESERTS